MRLLVVRSKILLTLFVEKEVRLSVDKGSIGTLVRGTNDHFVVSNLLIDVNLLMGAQNVSF